MGFGQVGCVACYSPFVWSRRGLGIAVRNGLEGRLSIRSDRHCVPSQGYPLELHHSVLVGGWCDSACGAADLVVDMGRHDGGCGVADPLSITCSGVGARGYWVGRECITITKWTFVLHLTLLFFVCVHLRPEEVFIDGFTTLLGGPYRTTRICDCSR